jgi:hypothetical protein
MSQQRKSLLDNFNIEIKHIDGKTKEIFYKNLNKENQENREENKESSDNYINIFNRTDNISSNLRGMNLTLLRKIKKRIENSNIFLNFNLRYIFHFSKSSKKGS